MNYQLSFIDPASNPRITKKQDFLAKLEKAVPWKLMQKVVWKHMKKNHLGRPRTDLLLMLKIMILQYVYNLSDPGMEDAIHDSIAFQKFLEIKADFAPDESTILLFRHFLEENNLQEKIFAEINSELTEQGLLLKRVTIVDATLIKASSSTKNQSKSRDPEMTSTKKGNNYHFGMKTHIGIDGESGLVHTLKASTAKVADIALIEELLHGEEKMIIGDKGYFSDEKKKKAREEGLRWGVLEKRKPQKSLSSKQMKKNKLFSSIRAKVEHPFNFAKNHWKQWKVKFKGIHKNLERWFGLMMLYNCWKIRDKGFVVA